MNFKNASSCPQYEIDISSISAECRLTKYRRAVQQISGSRGLGGNEQQPPHSLLITGLLSVPEGTSCATQVLYCVNHQDDVPQIDKVLFKL